MNDESGDHGGPGVQRLLSAAVTAIDGVPRPGQQQMADAVAAAMAAGEHLLVQAGTGTGKSLAYLVPALDHVQTAGRVVISTATLALQSQLVDRDLPAVLAACGPLLDRPVSYAILKGRNNYACLHRVREGAPDVQGVLVDLPGEVPSADLDEDVAADSGDSGDSGDAGELGRTVVALRAWAEQQLRDDDAGDRADAPSHTDRAWQQVSIGARECLGLNDCPYGSDCFTERSRDIARVSDLVITNHTLLAIDAADNGSIIPSHDVVIVDEAHELARRVTQVASAELTRSMVERVARRAASYLPEGDSAALTESAEALRGALDDARLGQVGEPATDLLAAVGRVRDAARTAYSGLGGGQPAAGLDPAEAARRQARAAVKEIFDVAERMAGLAPADVVWVAESRRTGRELRIAPLSVAMDVRDQILAKQATVLTSATLSLGGDFDAIAGQLGLAATDRLSSVTPVTDGSTDGSTDDSTDDDRPHRGWRGIDVGSPFAYEKQAICYIARGLPAPGREGPSTRLLDEVVDLVGAAGGRTLGLFSSHRAAEAATAAVREATNLEVCCQGEAHLGELAERFVAEPATSLFGTLSLWQGLDVPGATCTLVLIDRIPFPRPDDPLMSARQRAVDAAGGNGFMMVAASHAALLLAQGTGRLIRRDSDRGVVAILDSRLVRASYAGYLRASLPPMWPTADKAAVLGALRRLAADAVTAESADAEAAGSQSATGAS